jgi:hypothetical protein
MGGNEREEAQFLLLTLKHTMLWMGSERRRDI